MAGLFDDLVPDESRNTAPSRSSGMFDDLIPTPKPKTGFVEGTKQTGRELVEGVRNIAQATRGAVLADQTRQAARLDQAAAEEPLISVPGLDALGQARMQRGAAGAREAAGQAAQRIASSEASSTFKPRPVIEAISRAKSAGEAWDAFTKDPVNAIIGVTAQSAPTMVPALLAGVFGSPAAGAAVMGASSGGVEYGGSLIEFAQERGVNTKDAPSVQKFFENPENLREAMIYAGTRGGIVGAADLATAGIASKTLAPAALKGPLARQAANIPAQMGVQAAGGAAGEAGAQLATKGEIAQPGAVLLEAVGELGGAPAEVTALGRAARKPIQQEIEDVLNPDATIDEAIAAANQLATANSTLDRATEEYLADDATAAEVATVAPVGVTERTRRLVDAAAQPGFAADQAGALEQLRVAQGNQDAAPAADYVDLTPMNPLQARQRLAVVRDQVSREGGNALELQAVAHPQQQGAFAIVRRALPSLDLPAPAVAAPVAQQRIESAALAGSVAQRRADPEERGRQEIVTRAMRAIEARGGVASPYEAQVLRESNMGQPYDRVDPNLAPPLDEAEKLTQATGIAVGRAPRAEVQTTEQRERAAAETKAVVPAQQEAAARAGEQRMAQAAAEAPARAQARAVGEKAAREAGTGPRAAPDVDTVLDAASTAPFQRSAEQNLVLKEARTAFSAEEMGALNLQATAPATMTAEQRLAVKRLREPRASVIRNNASGESAASLEAQGRLAEEKRLGRTRVLVDRDGTARPLIGVDAVDQRVRPGQVILQRGVGRDEWTVLDRGDGVTPGHVARAIESAKKVRASTRRRSLETQGLTEVDPAELSSRARTGRGGAAALTREMHGLMQRLGRVYGKKVVVYDGDDGRDGFFDPADADTVYVNRTATKPHLVVFGHELLHSLKKSSPEAYAALEAAIKGQLKAGAAEKFAEDYGQDADTEELVADIVGNRLAEESFWAEVFSGMDRPAANRLGAAIVAAVNKAKKVIAGVPGFKTDELVEDLDAVKNAVTAAMREFAIARRDAAKNMSADGSFVERTESPESRASAGSRASDESSVNSSTNSSEQPREIDGKFASWDEAEELAAAERQVRASPDRDDLNSFRKSLGDQVRASVEYGAMLGRRHEWAFNVGDTFLSTHTGKTYKLTARSFSKVGKIKDNNWQPTYVVEGSDSSVSIVQEKSLLGSKTMKSLVTPRIRARTRSKDGPEANLTRRQQQLYIGRYLDEFELSGDTFSTNKDVGAMLQSNALDALGGESIATENTPANQKFIAEVIAAEAARALGKSGNAGQWYKKNLNDALSKAEELHPEIADDQDARFVFTFALAITSNGQTIAENTRLAFESYETWKKNGVLPSWMNGGGDRAGAMVRAFADFNSMIQNAGVPAVRAALLKKWNAKELMQSSGKSISALGDDVVYGGILFGPKIGGAFLQNLNSNYDALTIDRWFMRSWGRLTGSLTSDSGKTGLRDAPSSNGQRKYIRETMERALKIVRAQGNQIDMADLQATLWYPEKELYNTLGQSDTRSAPTDYAKEFETYVNARTKAKPARGAGRGAGRAAERQPDAGVPEQGGLFGDVRASTRRGRVSRLATISARGVKASARRSDKSAKVADDYADSQGISRVVPPRNAPLPTKLMQSLGDRYEDAVHNGERAEFKKTYDAFGKELLAQAQAILDSGLDVEPFDGVGEPYASSEAMIADVVDNKHLYFLKTDTALGSGGASSDLWALKDSGMSVHGYRMPYNDLIRWVHDYFGHTPEGYGFGPRGEFNAFLTHAQMFSPEARKALMAELLMQAGWFYNGRHIRREDGSVPKAGDDDFVPYRDRAYIDPKNVLPTDEQVAEVSKLIPRREAKAIVNIGLAVPDGSSITADEAVESLERNGGDVVSRDEHVSNTEPTLVAGLAEPLTAGQAEAVSRELKQESIAQRLADGTGELYGPKAEEWRPFNPDYFLLPDGTRASGVKASPARWDVEEPGKMDDFIRTMQDRQVDTKRVVAAVREQIGDIGEEWNPYLKEELYHGRTAKKTKDFLDFELRPLLQEMQARGVTMEEFETFLHNRHAEERNEQIAKINDDMPDGGSGINTADAQAYLAALPAAKLRAYEALAKRVDAINESTERMLVLSGLEKQETIDAWKKAYKHYVPLQREEFEDTSAGGTGRGMSVRGGASRRAMGSDKTVANILANVAAARERSVVRAEKNRVATALYGMAIKAPKKDFWLAFAPERMKNQAGIEQELVSLGMSPPDAAAVMAEPTQRYVDPRSGRVVQRVNPALRSADNVLSLRVNGEDRFVMFNASNDRAESMVRALKNLDADQLGRVLAISARISRYFASINTQWNPIFGIVNLTRDTQGALLNLSTTPIADRKTEVLRNTGSALVGIYADIRAHRKGRMPQSPWAQLWEEFQNEGGQTGFRDMYANPKERSEAIESEIKQITEGAAKASGRAILHWLSDYNTTLENAVRLSAYKAAKGKGISKQQAASIAKNLTVNFNRKGQVALQAGALYAFFNASAQGTARLIETMKGPAGKKIITGGLLLGVLQALALQGAGFDEEEPPEFVRDRNVVLPLGDGKFVSIPMPLGLHVLPSFSRRITEWMLAGGRGTGERLVGLAGLFADAFNPIGNAGVSLQTIAPTPVDWLAALAENRDFAGRPIAREDRSSLDPTPGHTRARDAASAVGKTVSYYLNLLTGGTDYQPGAFSPTPDQVDYFLGQLGGGLAREATKAQTTAAALRTGEELPAHKVPLLGRFYGDTTGQASVASKFYANLKRLNGYAAEIEGRRENPESGSAMEFLRENPEARLLPAAKAADRELTKAKRLKRDLIEKGASTERVRLVEQRITLIMNRLNSRVERLEESAD